MIEREYEGIKLKIYNGFIEYHKEEEIEFEFTDADGRVVDVDISQLENVHAESKKHFASNDTYTPDNIYWSGCGFDDPDKSIIAVIINPISQISLQDIHTMVVHELCHCTNCEEFRNSSEPYETKKGYIQEETKALRFEKFSLDNFKMTKLFVEMFTELGIVINS